MILQILEIFYLNFQLYQDQCYVYYLGLYAKLLEMVLVSHVKLEHLNEEKIKNVYLFVEIRGK